MKVGSPQSIDVSSNSEIPIGSNKSGLFINVLTISLLGIVLVCLLSLFEPEWAKSVFVGTRRWSVINLDWFLVLSANVLLIFCVILALSPWGKIRLGKQAKSFSDLSWFAMVTFTGFGLTLIFWGVTEPLAFYTDWWGVPFNQTAKTAPAAELGLAASLYHWGLHPWAIYATTAIVVAYASYNKSLPLSLSSALSPLLKGRHHAWSVKLIDSMTVIVTLLGVATTLGLGSRQAAKTLEHLYGIPNDQISQGAFILVISLILLAVMQKGLNQGIRRMSQVGLCLVVVFLLLFLVVSDISSAMGLIGNSSLRYLENFVAFSQWDDRSDLKFFHGWTVFYWLWWFSWAPFIGLFLAKISQGRSIRESVFGMVLLPTILTYIWFMLLGGVSLDQVIQGVSHIIEPRLSPSTALFNLLQTLPLGQWLSLIAMGLVLVCFITTSDSSLYIINRLSMGKNSRKGNQKFSQFWVLIQASIAFSLLIFGGKKALESVQSASLILGIVICVLLLLSSACLIWHLKQDKA